MPDRSRQAPDAPASPMVTAEDALSDALQMAWNDWCIDTGCVPDAFSIHGPRTTRVEADFGKGSFVHHVVGWLNAKGFDLAARPVPAPSEGPESRQ